MSNRPALILLLIFKHSKWLDLHRCHLLHIVDINSVQIISLPDVIPVTIVFVRGLQSRSYIIEILWYNIKGMPNPSSGFTFIYRLNQKSLAVICQHISVVLPNRCHPFNGVVPNPTARIYIDGIFTIYPVSIILTVLNTLYSFSDPYTWFGPKKHYPVAILWYIQHIYEIYCCSSCNVIWNLCIARNSNLTIRFV